LKEDMNVEKFFSKGAVNSATGCIEWTGCIQSNGYGRVKFDGRTRYVHRVSAELKFGEIPEGLEVCHKCDNRKCFNPDHLFLGTRKDNMQDAVSKSRISRGEKHAAQIPSGERNYNAKLKNSDIPEIRRRHASGETQTSIAKSFSVDRSLIGLIVNGKAWRGI